MLESDTTLQRGHMRQVELGEELQRRVRARADVLRLQRDMPERQRGQFYHRFLSSFCNNNFMTIFLAHSAECIA